MPAGTTFDPERDGNTPSEAAPTPSPKQPPAARSNESPLPPRIRIFVVEDHPLVRKGLWSLLNLQPNMQVCGEAVGVSSAKRGIPESHPDLALVDLGLEDGNGFELLDWLRQHHPRLKLLVLSGQEDTTFTERAFRCGAHGYVAKRDGPRELLSAIHRVMRNQRYVSSNAAPKDQPANGVGTRS
jgi:DNA-binding NarL/FixJ family response regulator